MNIVHFTTGRINPSAAKVGLVNVIYHVAHQQALAGDRVTVVVLPEKRDYANASALSFELKEYASPRLGGFQLDPSLLSDIDCGRLRMDIAHLHSVWSPTMSMLGRALAGRRIPYVLSSHGSFSPLLMSRQVFRKRIFRQFFALPLAQYARLLHLHSEDEIADAREFGVNVPTVVAEQGIDLSSVPDAIDRSWFDACFPQHQSDFKIVFLGRLDPFGKGLDLLLEALALVRHECPGTALFLVGPEKRRYRSEIPQLIRKLALDSHVHLLGPIYDLHEKYSALASADCFALPSRFEGFPLTLFEAMACGCPVLVTPPTHAASLVLHAGAGLVSPTDARSIANALLAMRADPDLRRMGERGKQAVRQFTWARTAERLTSAYREVLDA